MPRSTPTVTSPYSSVPTVTEVVTTGAPVDPSALLIEGGTDALLTEAGDTIVLEAA